MNFKQWIEFAQPTSLRDKVFYHATASWAAGQSILRSGTIQVPNLSDRKGMLRPRDGMTYISPSLKNAAIYALGGVMMGHNPLRPRIGTEQYGYIFAISGNELQDVEPDEDSIGEALASNNPPPWLQGLASRYVAPSRLRKVKDGEYAYYASVGKQLVKRMTDWQKLDLIHNYNAHIAHKGNLKFFKAWKLDKNRSKEIGLIR